MSLQLWILMVFQFAALSLMHAAPSLKPNLASRNDLSSWPRIHIRIRVFIRENIISKLFQGTLNVHICEYKISLTNMEVFMYAISAEL